MLNQAHVGFFFEAKRIKATSVRKPVGKVVVTLANFLDHLDWHLHLPMTPMVEKPIPELGHALQRIVIPIGCDEHVRVKRV